VKYPRVNRTSRESSLRNAVNHQKTARTVQSGLKTSWRSLWGSLSSPAVRKMRERPWKAALGFGHFKVAEGGLFHSRAMKAVSAYLFVAPKNRCCMDLVESIWRTVSLRANCEVTRNHRSPHQETLHPSVRARKMLYAIDASFTAIPSSGRFCDRSFSFFHPRGEDHR